MPGYSQSVAWSSEDGMYVASCPELNNLMALSDTEENAVKELKVAIDLVLQDMHDAGESIPEPQTYSLHSGQFRVRIPRTLHSRLVLQAQRERVSLNSLVNMFLAEASSQLTVSGFISERFKGSIFTDIPENDHNRC